MTEDMKNIALDFRIAWISFTKKQNKTKNVITLWCFLHSGDLLDCTNTIILKSGLTFHVSSVCSF